MPLRSEARKQQNTSNEDPCIEDSEGDLYDIFAVLQESATGDVARRELNNILVKLRRQRPDRGKRISDFMFIFLVTTPPICKIERFQPPKNRG
jgi:hypothetical protein